MRTLEPKSDKLEALEIKLFPNPTTGISILELEGKFTCMNLKINNQNGEELFAKLYEENIKMINLGFISTWDKGEYTVQINLDNSYIRELKLIKL